MKTSSAAPHAHVIARHIDDAAGRYACYPGIAQFHTGFGDAGFVEALRTSNGDPIPAKLSLHIGAPDRFGLYAVGAVRDEGARTTPHPAAFLNRLIRQIAAVGALCDRDRDVVQLGLSPGATDYFRADQIAEIVESLSRNFHFSSKPDRDFAATLSADALSRSDLRTLVDAGCNRAGFAVGHTDPQAAAAVVAIAPGAAVARCRAAGFRSVRTDVVFGASIENFDDFCARLAVIVRCVMSPTFRKASHPKPAAHTLRISARGCFVMPGARSSRQDTPMWAWVCSQYLATRCFAPRVNVACIVMRWASGFTASPI